MATSTPGHVHVYFEGIEMDWDTYAEWLRACGKAGIVSDNYVSHSLNRGMTCARPPGRLKGRLSGTVLERKTVVRPSTGPDDEPF